MKTRRIVILCIGVLFLALVSAVAVTQQLTVFAQQTGNLQVDPQIDRAAGEPPANLRTRVVMVSVLKDGKVMKQKETGMSDVPVNFDLPVGVYDVRVEGDSVNSVTKSGIHVTPGDSTNVLPAMRAGAGVCDCKYSK
jgi:hypothetical protein